MNEKIIVNNQELMALVKEQINNKNVTLTIKGNSMLPFFRDGRTIITLEKPKKLKRLDVVLFKYNDIYILHRIIKIKEKIVTQGDGLISKEIIDETDVVAVVKFFEKNRKLTFSNNKFYLFKVRMWRILRPFRRVLLKLVKK